MSESGNDAARETEMMRVERERHEKAVIKVIISLEEKTSIDEESGEEKKYVRSERGERITLLPLEEGAKDCVACCEAVILGDKESVPERTKDFGARDLVSDALEAAGYRVVVDYDHEKSTGDVDCLRYSLFEKAK